jgi:type VI secretion system secreted protein VgrG
MADTIGPVTLTPPAGLDFKFNSMFAVEELGVLFRFDVEVLATDFEIQPAQLLNKPMTVHLDMGENPPRHFNGVITEFTVMDPVGSFAVYRLTLRPLLSLLAKANNCRVFPKKTPKDIVLDLLKERGIPIEPELTGKYPKLEYTVQYRESDFNFITRLMEQYGMYFYFKHEEARHVMVLCDSVGAHGKQKGYEELRYIPPDANRDVDFDYIDGWRLNHSVTAGAYALSAFDFEKPKADLKVRSPSAEAHALAELEFFDFPGEYLERGDGEELVKTGNETLQVPGELTEGEGNPRGLCCGFLFNLADHPVEAQNREYLVTSSKIMLATHDVASGGDSGQVCRINFSTIPSSRPFRPRRRARKPYVRGTQTAIVVGRKGEEISTDKYGRVKVRFHWDRFSEKPEEDCCWLRVSQAWAGANFGSMHIPRVGEEVIVGFMEGDPDDPVVIGRVYNFDNMPPWELDKHQTQSGFRSRSTKKGGLQNFNEIRFEDKKGEEELFIQAEKTQTTKVKGSQSISVAGSQTTTVHDKRTVIVDKDVEEKYHAKHSITVTAAQRLQAESQEFISKNAAGKLEDGHITFDAGTNIELKCGATTHVFLDSAFVNLEATSKIQLKCGASLVEIEGPSIKITLGGSTVVVNPAGVTVSGPLVKLNC